MILYLRDARSVGKKLNSNLRRVRDTVMTPWDLGKRAARNGLSRKSNPFDHPDHQLPGDAWERKASEWDEGFDGYDAEYEAAMRTEKARKAAKTRWGKVSPNAALTGAEGVRVEGTVMRREIV